MTDRVVFWREWLWLVSVGLLCSACMQHEPLPCSADSCDGPVTTCPANPFPDESVIAAVALRCEYGEECCCGKCYPSQICLAQPGEPFACLNTDSCLVQSCD
jgi:hypothetical protein